MITTDPSVEHINGHAISWIAADWGTTRLRVWAMADDGSMLSLRQSDEGMGGLTADQFEAKFAASVAGWVVPGQRIQVVVCGMAGAREGWAEAGYRSVPSEMHGNLEAVAPQLKYSNWDVRILPGLSQDSPADVMRGEETQIAGYLAQDPAFDGLIVLPGTHTKWARVKNGTVLRFATCMTGELFQVIGSQSIIKRSIGAEQGWDAAAFDAAVVESFQDPAGVTRRIFGLRAQHVLHGAKPAQLRARLSGELIGVELADQLRSSEGLKLVLIGAPDLSALYQRALALIGRTADLTSADAMTLAGLNAARKGLNHA